MTGWRALALAGAAIAALVTGAATWLSGTNSPAKHLTQHSRPHLTGPAATDAAAFLRTYVQPNGQVIRHGDGDDTVSEGQAYALLLSQVADQPATFARVWRWTAAHLQQRSGLLAWQANAAGKVQSTQPASDADLLTAWALSRTTGSGSDAFHAQARRIAAAILANEVVKKGPKLLAAGPWATGAPASLDPSYWTPAAFNAMARLTGNQEWDTLAATATLYTKRLTHDGQLLPPDWAHLEGSAVYANPAPNGGTPTVQYGLDAQRLPVWMATSCQPTDRRLAADWWATLSHPDAQGAMALNPDGSTINGATTTLGYVAAAASAQAAGHKAQVTRLLGEATTAEHEGPNYYQAAWLALGEALLTTDALGSCP